MEYIRPLNTLTAEMLDLCLTLEPGFADMDNLAFLEASGDEFVYLLGMCFCSSDLAGIKAFSNSRLWFTYRKNFAPIGGTGPTSDRGWGCMLRCGQMLLAQALSVVHLGRNWQWQLRSPDPNYRRLLAMFQDTRNSLFSIHQIAQMGVSEGKALGEWLGPNTIAQVIKKLVVYDDWSSLAVHVALDNILISEDVRIMAAQEDLDFSSLHENTAMSESNEGEVQLQQLRWKRPLLVIVPLRLGLTIINRCYLTPIQEFFKLPQCAGIIGGRPNHAVYFYGCAGEKETLELKDVKPLTQSSLSGNNSSPYDQLEFIAEMREGDGGDTLGSNLLEARVIPPPPTTPNISSSTTTENMSLDGMDEEVISSNGGADALLDVESCSSSAGVLLSFSSNNSSMSAISNRNSQSSLPISDASITMDSLDTLCCNNMTTSTITAINEQEDDMIHVGKQETQKEGQVSPILEENSAQSPSTSFIGFPTGDHGRETHSVEGANDETNLGAEHKEDLFDDSTYHCTYLLNMDFGSLDPSLALAFVCVCEEDYNDLVERLNNSVINSSSPPLFEILDKRPKGWPKFVPYVGHDDSLQLKEFDDFGDPQFDSDDNFELLE